MTTEHLSASIASTESIQEVSFLDKAINATLQTPVDSTKMLMSTLTSQALDGTVIWDKNLTLTIEKAIIAIDEQISLQLSSVMKNKEFQNWKVAG